MREHHRAFFFSPRAFENVHFMTLIGILHELYRFWLV